VVELFGIAVSPTSLTLSGLVFTLVLMIVTGKGVRTEREFLEMKSQRDHFRDAWEKERNAKQIVVDSVLKLEQEDDARDAETKLMLTLIQAMHTKVMQ